MQRLLFPKQLFCNKPKFYCGVDGGATKTRAVILDEEGNSFQGFSKASNPNKVGIKESRKNLIGAIQNTIILNNLSIELNDITNIYFGVAGVGIPDIKKQLSSLLKEALPNTLFEIETDAKMALASVAKNSKPGIIQIAGTGAITFGKNHKIEARSDGFGSTFGDKGSGFYIGKKGIESVLNYLDNRSASTTLVNKIFNYFGVNGLNDLKKYILDSAFNPSFFAEFVSDEAKKGDEVSTRIIRKASLHIADSIISVIDKLNLRKAKFDIGLCGSVFKTGELITLPIIHKVSEYSQSARFLPELIDPALSGALSAKACLVI